MAFHVMNPDGRNVEAERQATRDGGTCQQGADQARAACIGNAVESGFVDPGIRACLPDQWDELPDVVA